MAKIQTYNDMEIEVLWSSPFPGIQVKKALDTTMRQMLPKNADQVTSDMLRFLFSAEHSSVVEHAVISFMITGASRAWLAQITRHRIASPTSSSQHYQNYSDYPLTVCDKMKQLDDISGIFGKFFDESLDLYEACQENDIAKEDARMVLTEAETVNFMWTINARSLHNFFRIRPCLRNVDEMKTFANKLFPLVQHWWPEYAKILGPACYADGKCNQGIMSCGRKWKHFSEFIPED